MKNRIGFNRSSLQGNELEYISQAIFSGEIAGDQTFSKKCQTLLERELGVAKALVTSSCTHALEMAALLLDVKEGDEIILPSFTFTSTANAFVLQGARPVFCDIRPDTLNLDETKLEALVSGQTKAIVPVHYAGIGCEMDAICSIAERHGIAVIEDNAHGLFGKYKGRPLGTFGSMGTQSFHETKNITCGEGGALLINDAQLISRAEIIREKGTNRASFFRGEVNKYAWVDVGSSYVMSDVLAAFLYGQLEKWSEIQERRKVIWERYQTELCAWSASNDVQQPFVPQHCEPAWHLYYLIMPSLSIRSAFITHLKDRGIHAVFHYMPLHSSEYGKQWQTVAGGCPVTDRVSDCLVRLPLYPAMSDVNQSDIIEAVMSFRI